MPELSYFIKQILPQKHIREKGKKKSMEFAQPLLSTGNSLIFSTKVPLQTKKKAKKRKDFSPGKSDKSIMKPKPRLQRCLLNYLTS